MRAAKEGGSLLPPKHILNSPTKLMKSEGYGSGYEYDHDAPDAFSGQDYFPEALGRQTFYDPPDRGFERENPQAAGLLGQAARRPNWVASMIQAFDYFVGIDWSGDKKAPAKGFEGRGCLSRSCCPSIGGMSESQRSLVAYRGGQMD